MADTVRIAFGRGHLEVRLPDGAQPTLIRKRQLAKLPDPHSAVRAALDAGPLAELARGKTSACILICDITRPVPNGLFLRPMIETLTASGHIRPEIIVILVATGLHRPNEGEELDEVVGDHWVLRRTGIEPFRPQRRGPCRPRGHPPPRHAREN